MCDLIFSLQEFLKIVPGLVIFPFTMYLVWKKLGVKVTASISTRNERTVAPRISDVVLMNLKDKPVTVFAIYAVIDGDISWELDKFDPPIVLKSLESTRIETQPYSELWLDSGNFSPDFIKSNIEIFLVLSHKVVRCKMVTHPNLMHIPAFASYRNASKHTKRFNNIVYNEFAAYAITYSLNSEINTAIVDRSGFICCNWNFHFNMFPPEAMNSRENLKRYLDTVEFGKMTKGFTVDVLK
jgi:hypothetical protein